MQIRSARCWLRLDLILLLLPVTIITGDFFMIISGDEG